jgi:hypothetical protein
MYVPMMKQDQLTLVSVLCTVSSFWSTHHFLPTAVRNKHAHHAMVYNDKTISLLRRRLVDWEQEDLNTFTISMSALIMSQVGLQLHILIKSSIEWSSLDACGLTKLRDASARTQESPAASR